MFQFRLKKNSFHTILILWVMLYLTACSQSQGVSNASGGTNKDTLERHNRDIFKFNTSIDKLIFKPVAVTYQKITPDIVDIGISNFFDNLEDVGTAVNNLLQFKPGEALIDVERVMFNSTIGLGGLFDVATKIGLEKHDEDFGQTLAVWGVGSGPYIMLPFLGPSTLRDFTSKLTVDSLLDPAKYSKASIPLFVVDKVDSRADLISEEEAFKDFSDDEYSALRDAWLQRREFLIRDGKVDEDAQSDLIDALEDLDDE